MCFVLRKRWRDYNFLFLYINKFDVKYKSHIMFFSLKFKRSEFCNLQVYHFLGVVSIIMQHAALWCIYPSNAVWWAKTKKSCFVVCSSKYFFLVYAAYFVMQMNFKWNFSREPFRSIIVHKREKTYYLFKSK